MREILFVGSQFYDSPAGTRLSLPDSDSSAGSPSPQSPLPLFPALLATPESEAPERRAQSPVEVPHRNTAALTLPAGVVPATFPLLDLSICRFDASMAQPDWAADNVASSSPASNTKIFLPPLVEVKLLSPSVYPPHCCQPGFCDALFRRGYVPFFCTPLSLPSSASQ